MVERPLVLSRCLKVLPPGAGKESISGTSEKMLECRSSKFTVGRKSNDPDGGLGSRLLAGAVNARL